MNPLHALQARALLAFMTAGCLLLLTAVAPAQAQQAGGQTGTQPAPGFVFGGVGNLWLSQFANPALVGSLYLTPNFPITGYYPIYPGGFTRSVPTEGLDTDPVQLRPFVGFGEMYTDNVLRTASNRKSDFIHTFAPGIQARLPFAGFHEFVVDYRTNLQYYERNPSNDVSDQTASGKLKFDFPGGLKVDLQGEHKVGHDPRGSAVDNAINKLELNKWTTNGFLGRVEYVGVQASLRMDAQSFRWKYTNNDQGIISDRITNYLGMTFSASLTPKTSVLTNVSATQLIYDQNKNLDSTIYSVSGGARWDVTELTSGEILVGYQNMKFNNASANQPGPVLSLFQREKDSFSNLFVAGNLYWRPTSYLTVSVQPYRAFQQTVVAGTLFFVATGMNFSATHDLTTSTALNLNLGLEQDKFTGSQGVGINAARTDVIKNVAFGLRYRALRWLGASLQYAFEDRSSTDGLFVYNANTFMLALQSAF